MKFRENKCKVLHLRRNPMCKYRLKNICLDSGVAEKIWRVIAEHKLSRQSAAAAEGHIYSAA